MSAEIPSSAQLNESGIASSELTRLEAPAGMTLIGRLCTLAAGREISGCVFVILTVGVGAAAGRGKTLIRAVSFFGPGDFKTPADPESVGRTPAGFGSGGENAGGGGNNPADDSSTGDGGNGGGERRGGIAGGTREGKRMRAVSRLAPASGSAAGSGRGGNAMRTVSFFGSAITNHGGLRKIAENTCIVTV